MNDHIFGYWDDQMGKRPETPHTASQKSLNDRDGIDIWYVQNATHIHNGDDISDWDGTLMDGLNDEQFPMKEWGRTDDESIVEYFNKQQEKDLVEFLQSSEYASWQEEIAEREKIGDFRETKEKRFYGVVKVKKADLISPSEGELMSYYIDYGFNNIEEVIKEYGEEEMLREWYNNTNFTSEFTLHRQDHSINHFDWEKESEDVEIISEEEWNDYKKYSW